MKYRIPFRRVSAGPTNIELRRQTELSCVEPQHFGINKILISYRDLSLSVVYKQQQQNVSFEMKFLHILNILSFVLYTEVQAE